MNMLKNKRGFEFVIPENIGELLLILAIVLALLGIFMLLKSKMFG